MRLLLFFLFFTIALQPIMATKYGNYHDSRIGSISDPNSRGLLYYSDREWMYDFDTSAPLEGITSSNSTFEVNSDYYMTNSQSLSWNSSTGASITFQANINLKYVFHQFYLASVGIFQKEQPDLNQTRSFKLECLGATNNVIYSSDIYLHKTGWNILGARMDIKGTQYVDKVRITQTNGASGQVLIDNLMLYVVNSTGSATGVQTRGITSPTLSLQNADNYPIKPLTNDEKEAFAEIAERIIPMPEKLTNVSTATIDKFRNLHAKYDIQVNGDFANGMNPLYYWRSLEENGPSSYMYNENQYLCQQVKELGKAWYQTNDATQKEELGRILTDFVKLSLTYGAIPNPWYNGRGYAEGIYYARELLESEGILEGITEQLILQYGLHDILYNEHSWSNPIALSSNGPDFFWKTTADDLNTGSKSTMISILVGPDSPEKARNLYRLKSWLDNLGLNYSPNRDGTLKPDGSWFHHWGNRFDNYGWYAGWRGATEYVYWMSQTPFKVSTETHERMIHMANIHFDVMNEDGYVGPQDAMSKISSEGFLNLARAGSADGSESINFKMGSYWLVYPEDKSYIYNPAWVSKIKGLSITPAQKKQCNITLSYDISNVHRWENWQAYTRGISDNSYHTQYQRDGFLFYNIGGISLCKVAQASGLQSTYGASIMLRYPDDEANITAGYNISRAPGVTSVQSDYNQLRQIYYQSGTSPFVGGISTSNGNGIFTQVFNGQDKSFYASTPASGLRFQKSYFYFGRDIIALASGISNNGNNTNVETGLLQETVKNGINTFTFSNNITTTETNYDLTYSSNDVPWMLNSHLNTGVFLFPDQTYKVFKGQQSFGASQGEIISSYLQHDGQSTDSYSFIIRLNTNSSELSQLTYNQLEGKPDYKILKQDEKAHIVAAKKMDEVGYVIFDINALQLPDELKIKEVNTPCVIMTKELYSQGQLLLTISDPDKHFSKTAANPLGWSLPSEINIRISGEYSLASTEIKNTQLTYDPISNTTYIQTEVKNGLSTELILQENRSKNSLPWVEDFNLPDETLVDNGFSTWSMNAFDPQEIGYAHVENNSFVISGINCDWQSDLIDISSSNNISVSINTRCDEPRRLNSNDSLCIFMSIDGEEKTLYKKWIDDFEPQKVEFNDVSGNQLQIFIEGRSDRNRAAYIIDEIRVEKANVKIESITILPESKHLPVGDSFFPEIAIYPANADNPAIIWKSDSPEFLSVSNDGEVRPLKQGTFKAIALSLDENITDTISIISEYPTLPSPWTQGSIGKSVLGSVNMTDDLITIKGNGPNANPQTDNMHCMFYQISGDFEISGKVTCTAQSIAGFFARENNTNGSKNVTVALSDQEGTHFSYRHDEASDARLISGDINNSSCWLKLKRSGSRLYGYDSVDGVNWNLIRSTSISLSNTLMIGMMVYGDSYPVQSEASFSDLNIQAVSTDVPTIENEKIAVYPNPVKDILYINNGSSHIIKHIQLLDMKNTIVLSKNLNISANHTFQMLLNSANLNSGIFILRIINDKGGIVTRKIFYNH